MANEHETIPAIQSAELRAFLLFLRRVLLMLVAWIEHACGYAVQLSTASNVTAEIEHVLTERDWNEIARRVNEMQKRKDRR